MIIIILWSWNQRHTSLRQAAKQASLVEVNIRAWKKSMHWSIVCFVCFIYLIIFSFVIVLSLSKGHVMLYVPCRCLQSVCWAPAQSSTAFCKPDPIGLTSSPGDHDDDNIIFLRHIVKILHWFQKLVLYGQQIKAYHVILADCLEWLRWRVVCCRTILQSTGQWRINWSVENQLVSGES